MYLYVVAVLFVVLILVLFFRYPKFKNDLQMRKMPVVVTGSASGVGKSVCAKLIAEGCFVFAADLNEVGLNNLYSTLDRKSVLPIVLDVTNSQSIQNAVALVERE